MQKNWQKNQTPIFLFSIFLNAIATGIFVTSLNNFLADVYNLSANQRGVIETIRETPGMLLFLILAPLSAIKEGGILIFSLLLSAVGMAGINLSSGVIQATAWLFIWSTGIHLVMTLRESFCLALSEPHTRGRLFGLMTSLRSLGSIIGAACIWVGMGHLGFGYKGLYWAAGALAALSASSVAFIKEGAHLNKPRKAFVIKRKYSLFYTLAVLFGVRKQIFLVFGPWVLIRIFNQDASAMARLMVISSAVGFFIKPYLGRLIDRYGERTVLMGDSMALILICACYGLAETHFPKALVLPSLFASFILDDCLFSLRLAHVTYLSKIADSTDELTTSISTSYSIEHLVSMAAPVLAGMIWVRFGYEWVFFVSAFVAILMFAASANLPRKKS